MILELNATFSKTRELPQSTGENKALRAEPTAKVQVAPGRVEIGLQGRAVKSFAEKKRNKTKRNGFLLVKGKESKPTSNFYGLHGDVKHHAKKHACESKTFLEIGDNTLPPIHHSWHLDFVRPGRGWLRHRNGERP